jgi:hypothetical protein
MDLNETPHLAEWFAWLLDTLDAHGGFDAAMLKLLDEEESMSTVESSP